VIVAAVPDGGTVMLTKGNAGIEYYCHLGSTVRHGRLRVTINSTLFTFSVEFGYRNDISLFSLSGERVARETFYRQDNATDAITIPSFIASSGTYIVTITDGVSKVTRTCVAR
jgi:hypothetical protein